MMRYALILLCLSANAATLTQSVSCEAFTASSPTLLQDITHTGSNQCSADIPGGGHFNGAHTSGHITFNATDGAMSAEIFGVVEPDWSVPSNGTFTGNLVFRETLTDGGPARPGFLQYDASALPGNPYSGRVNGVIAIGGYVEVGGGGNTFGHSAATIPVTLGTLLALSVTEDVFILASRNDGSSGGGVKVTMAYHFFEADGVTPVVMQEYIAPNAIDPTPEPGTWGLCFAAVALLVVKRPLVCRA